MDVRIKRIYEPPHPQDGKRILVDRLWPRGVSRQKARLDVWMKEVAPSPELRQWFGHRPERFDEFSRLYRNELTQDPVHIEKLEQLRDWATQETITLLYAARDPDCNHARVLQHVLLNPERKS
ncbi:MAG: DUF488 family protein [Bacillaceae bacterium]|nr:DUF488 family protein [Bacillaceae bacterium]